MEKPSSSKTELTVLRSYFWILLILWTVLVGSILLWSLFRQKYETEEVARIQARNSFEKDLVYRRWAAGHGGVYVPMTDKTPANPYLSHIEERDITTPSGRVFTLVNPAYMTRQVHELGLEQYGSRGHITSLKPIRPANAADEWETKALRAFEQGVKEVSSIEKLDNQNYMRLMRPMITEQSCLKCHAEQGYKVGDLRGGISVSVPMAPIQAIARGHALTLAVGHFVLWLLGVGGISLGGQRLKQRIQERKYAEEQIESLAKFPSENPNPVLRIASNGVLLYANSSSRSFLAKWDCAVGKIVPENWHQTVSEVFASGSYKRVEAEHVGRVFAFVVAPVPEADYVNLYGRDITERKEIAARQQLAGKILARLNQKSQKLDLIRDVVKLVKEFTGFAAVGVRLREGEDFPYFEVNGFSDDFVEAENYLCARNEKGEQIYDAQGHPVLECMCGSVIIGHADPALPFFTEGGSFWTNSTTELQACTSLTALQVPLRSRCNEAGYESVALIPLRCGDEIVGLLQLNDIQPGRFTPEIVRFFEEVGASIGIALARVRAEEQVENVAKFPSENPYPVLRIAKDSTVLYANAAGYELLKSWGCNIGGRAPEHWHQYILRILKSGLSEDLEIICKDRIFSLIMAPVADAGYVNAYGIDITERKHAEEDLRKYREHLEELVQTRTAELTEANKQLLQEIEARKQLEKEILNISEREQRRIGQELHDSLGQQLTGIGFMTKVLEQKLADKLPNEAASTGEIAKLVSQAMDQARGLARGLHPVDLEAGSLMSALQELAATTESLFGIRCSFKCDKPVEMDDTAVAVHLYRIAQEAVTNAIKHGEAKNIQIGLAYSRDKSVLTVKSDGLDFPEEAEARGTGMGLQIMDHRVDIIGGSLDIHKAPKGGTILTCTFPNKTP